MITLGTKSLKTAPKPIKAMSLEGVGVEVDALTTKIDKATDGYKSAAENARGVETAFKALGKHRSVERQRASSIPKEIQADVEAIKEAAGVVVTKLRWREGARGLNRVTRCTPKRFNVQVAELSAVTQKRKNWINTLTEMRDALDKASPEYATLDAGIQQLTGMLIESRNAVTQFSTSVQSAGERQQARSLERGRSWRCD